MYADITVKLCSQNLTINGLDARFWILLSDFHECSAKKYGDTGKHRIMESKFQECICAVCLDQSYIQVRSRRHCFELQILAGKDSY